MDVQKLFLTCPDCKASVPAIYSTKIESPDADDTHGLIHFKQIIVGDCPWCKLTLVGNMDDLPSHNSHRKWAQNAQHPTM